MKLELKHLAAYLPYGLKCLNQHLPDKELVIEELIGVSNHILWSGVFMAKHGSNHIPISAIKPILRPLSDLTKEIEVNGEMFVPLDYFDKNIAPLGTTHEEMKLHFIESDLNNMRYTIIQKLHEWHFDTFNLIENNLAIDINTIK